MATKKLAFVILILILVQNFYIADSTKAQQTRVLVVKIEEPITPATPEILKEALEKAQSLGANALIIILNTPGGGLSETFQITQLIASSPIPIIGYVYPLAAHAVSAGTFILMSTHIAAMAPHTIIGSCQPIEVTPEGSKYITENKTINHLVKILQEHASIHNRNVSVVEKFVTENRNLNATEANELGVIEIIASSIQELLEQADGMNVTTSIGNLTLSTANAQIVYYEPSIKLQILKVLSNPLLASLLLMLGIFGLIFGISTPGHGAEILGIICICLGLIGTGFELNYVALFLVIFGSALLLIELFTPGFGIIGIAGIICLIIGTVFLIPMTYPRWLVSEEFQKQLVITLLAPPAVVAGFFIFALFKIIKIRRKKPAIGEFVGEEAETIEEISKGKEGFVMFKGEYWRAKSEDETIPQRTRVVIVRKDHATLVVKKKSE
ncbi:MAG: nodulation protein NfeD [Candidatus Thermoplasmatota archaeon]|nr:nodulation protein NfeD [Candidatus Thermoplasmatota archaeon]